MESFFEMPQKVNCCPMFCILKGVLFAVIIVFMLFLPLGDPNIACNKVDSAYNTRKAMCYLCEVYFGVTKATNKAVEAINFALCVIGNLLYEGKLKFYALLERMDKQDLCTSICCRMDDELSLEERKESRCPHCKCYRRKCSRRPRTECGS